MKRSFNAVLLVLILIGTLLEAWKIYASQHEKWTDTSNIHDFDMYTLHYIACTYGATFDLQVIQNFSSTSAFIQTPKSCLT